MPYVNKDLADYRWYNRPYLNDSRLVHSISKSDIAWAGDDNFRPWHHCQRHIRLIAITTHWVGLPSEDTIFKAQLCDKLESYVAWVAPAGDISVSTLRLGMGTLHID